MRTTVDLDEDVLRAAKSIARQGEKSLGSVLSELARRGLTSRDGFDVEDGLPVFRVRPGAPIVTLEDVRRDEDEPW